MGLSNGPRMSGCPVARKSLHSSTKGLPLVLLLAAMTKRHPFRLPVLILTIAACAGFCRGQELGKVNERTGSGKGPEKAPSVIPAPRAEPVVPPSPAKSIAAQLNDAFVSVFERVAPAVVIIDVTKKPTSEAEGNDYFHDFLYRQAPDGEGSAPDGPGNGRRQKPQSEGSGFVIQSGGYILTNNHVVTGADKITVKLKDGRQFPAKLTGTDEKTDIAVVKIEATDLPVEELADSDSVRVGELACAIGVPYNLDYTFTTGVVSAKGRNRLDLGSADNYEDYIQTDASINPGNSGGPLVNLDGKVIGMNTLINGLNRGLGFAIPSNMLREVGDQLIHSGRVIRPYIGVRMETLDEAVEFYGPIFGDVKKGVVVVSIMADSPAFKNKDLHQADVITEVDGVPVGSDRELQKQILTKKVGATVQLTVFRKGKAIKLPVTTSELPAEVAQANPNGPGAEPDGDSQRQEAAQFGMQLQDLNKDLAANLGVTASSGVVVTSVADDSPAARAQINVKDVITAVDNVPVKDLASFKEAAKAGDLKRGIMCYLERPAGKSFAVIRGD